MLHPKFPGGIRVLQCWALTTYPRNPLLFPKDLPEFTTTDRYMQQTDDKYYAGIANTRHGTPTVILARVLQKTQQVGIFRNT